MAEVMPQVNPANEDKIPAYRWVEIFAVVLLLLGLGLKYFGEKDRFLDTRTQEARQAKMGRPGVQEIIEQTWSPAKQAGLAVLVVGGVIGIISIIMRVTRKKDIGSLPASTPTPTDKG